MAKDFFIGWFVYSVCFRCWRVRGNAIDLCSAALEAGYADQAHMTRECGELAGQSPVDLIAGTAINARNVRFVSRYRSEVLRYAWSMAPPSNQTLSSARSNVVTLTRAKKRGNHAQTRCGNILGWVLRIISPMRPDFLWEMASTPLGGLMRPVGASTEPQAETSAHFTR